METSSYRQAIEAQFDCLSKKVIKRAVLKGYRDMKRREKRECSDVYKRQQKHGTRLNGVELNRQTTRKERNIKKATINTTEKKGRKK